MHVKQIIHLKFISFKKISNNFHTKTLVIIFMEADLILSIINS